MSRALDFFLAPPEPEPSAAGSRSTPGAPLAPTVVVPAPSSPPPAALVPGASSSPAAVMPGVSSASPAARVPGASLAPAVVVPAPSSPPPAALVPGLPFASAVVAPGSPPVPLPPLAAPPSSPAAAAPGSPRPSAAGPAGRTRRKRRARNPVAAAVPPAALIADAGVLTGAAVLGRPREAEPVAAALALALRRETRAKVATVAVVGPPLPEASSGGGAGRRVAARLEAHGLEPRVRGRLVWVRLDPASPELASLVWQVALLAAPVVLAVTAPRTPAIDAALVEQDLTVLVTTEPDGPLAQAAGAGLGHIVPTRPLKRGLARELSRAGIRAAGPIRALVDAHEGSRR
ncbi:hypothetical protein DVA67_028865 [Solirubrobacter sp. CPCC 204708]|uniref:Uncharacterized protein n=1 Tax=Solirubrobacter deserti TaxID=2282478 RepID=A0ABT4RUM9_9ACTN|nr:hypothetical protein [Solirubrobacter deserti]MBE2320011.1 hypothetical protein [Solirubrobacter deserti]MDA0141955.1 hypothetical protein [Solirubrobacter deserti]